MFDSSFNKITISLFLIRDLGIYFRLEFIRIEHVAVTHCRKQLGNRKLDAISLNYLLLTINLYCNGLLMDRISQDVSKYASSKYLKIQLET